MNIKRNFKRERSKKYKRIVYNYNKLRILINMKIRVIKGLDKRYNL